MRTGVMGCILVGVLIWFIGHLEFLHGFIEQDAPVYHLGDKSLKLIFHDGTLRVIRFQPESNY